MRLVDSSLCALPEGEEDRHMEERVRLFKAPRLPQYSNRSPTDPTIVLFMRGLPSGGSKIDGRCGKIEK